MVDIIQLEDAPSQKFTLTIDRVRYDFLFMYNQIADRWSVTITPEGQECPIQAGRFLFPGMNLIDRVSKSTKLMVVDNEGVIRDGMLWYDRLVKPLSDGVSSTFLVFGSNAGFTELGEDGDIVQPFC